MNEVECLRFPLLGTLQDGETFQYLLLNIDDKEAEISIGSWIVRRVKLNLGEEVQLYIPSRINENFLPGSKLRWGWNRRWGKKQRGHL